MVKLTKEERIKRVNLRKSEVVRLTKDTPLEDLKSRVALVLDCSGSMSDMFSDGRIQEVIERLLPLALKFDDNGELDFWLFSDDSKRMDGITIDNFYGLVNKILDDVPFSGTSYAPVMEDVLNTYVVDDPADIPNYVIFITDGDNWDRGDAERVITKGSNYPVFWQFVGIGDSSFQFLSHLDDMDGRYVDNANFFQLNDLEDIDDKELYKRLLSEYPQWLGYPEVKEMLQSSKELKKSFPEEMRKGRLLSKFKNFILELFG